MLRSPWNPPLRMSPQWEETLSISRTKLDVQEQGMAACGDRGSNRECGWLLNSGRCPWVVWQENHLPRPFSDLHLAVGFFPQAGNSKFGGTRVESPAWASAGSRLPHDPQSFSFVCLVASVASRAPSLPPTAQGYFSLSDFSFKSINFFQKSMSFYLNIFYPNLFPVICGSV